MKFRCPTCTNGNRPIEFESDDGQCPKCGKVSAWELVDVHFIVVGSGPLFGALGRQHVACEPKRDAFALPGEFWSATGDPRQVTCLSCKGTQAWKEAARFEAKFDRAFAKQLRNELEG